MIIRNKSRILIWAVVILLATNLSMGFSFLYHKQQDKQLAEQTEEEAIEAPAQQRTRFFREQLNLQPGQMDTFRKLNRNFNRTAWNITHKLQSLRLEMIEELGKSNPNKDKLDSIAEEIGFMHRELKLETIHYYLEMREVCNEEQREMLNTIFIAMLKNKEDIQLPQRGRRWRNR